MGLSHTRWACTNHSDAVKSLQSACSVLSALVGGGEDCQCKGVVLLHSNKSPSQGGASGAVAAAFLLLRAGEELVENNGDGCSCSRFRHCRDARRAREALRCLRYARSELRELGWPSLLPTAFSAHWADQFADVSAPAAAAPPLPIADGSMGSTDQTSADQDETVVAACGAAMRRLRLISKDPQLVAISNFIDPSEASGRLRLRNQRG